MRGRWWQRRIAVAKRAVAVVAIASPALAAPPSPARPPLVVEEPPASYAAEIALLAKVAPYDTAFGARAGDGVEIGILTRAGDMRSSTAAATLQAELGRVGTIGGLPHQEVVLPFRDAAALITACRVRRVAILLVTPGFGPELESIRAAVDGIDILTVAVAPSDVTRGLVLGFDITAGKLKMLLNRTEALRHNVKFRTDAIRIMKIVG